MKLVRLTLIACLLQGAAWAQQKFEVGVFGAFQKIRGTPLGTMSTSNEADNDSQLKDPKNARGVRLTLNTKGYYGHELSYSVSKATFRTNYKTTNEDGEEVSSILQDRVTVRRFSYNFLVYFMPRNERFRPFVTGGVDQIRYSAPHITDWTGGGSKNYGFNWGLGLKVKLVPHTLLRLDARHQMSGKPYQQLSFADVTNSSGHIAHLEASVGFSVTF